MEDIWIKNNLFGIDSNLRTDNSKFLFINAHVYIHIKLHIYIHWKYIEHILCTKSWGWCW